MTKKVAVLIAGCGYLDGAEIRESVFTLLALDQAGAKYQVVSLDKNQMHVVDHKSGTEVSGEGRNILSEAARIARGDVKPINAVKPEEFDAVIMPGGFGVAKNFSNFATNGANGAVDKEVADFVMKTQSLGKPIGAICIAPAVLALLFGTDGYSCTIGNDPETAKAISLTGAGHVSKAVNEIYVDEAMNVVSTPAYMYDDAKISEVYDGIKKCVDKVIALS